MLLMKDKNIVETSNNNFSPTSGMTRAQVAESIYRLMVLRETGGKVFDTSLVAELDQ